MTREQIAARGVRDPRVLEAMRAVPRERFVPARNASLAFADGPLPIGCGQTISQPYIVAYMTEALALGPGDRVLEIGTGSGYQTAVLAEIAAEVYTVETVTELAARARRLLGDLGYGNVFYRVGDGSNGWPEHAPYDAIVVTAAPPELPPALAAQLADGGRLVAPVGAGLQELVLVRRRGDGTTRRKLIDVRFVPMTGRAGEDR
ncbi:MAG: protein-L-isoaspartate(D-aspartate) O-methyltransferase [Candidatus Krumholzibacteriota bacterium]|nr:protein-L-isoaspartate(D-aspartate) O-methyltransferase [Candidatus Krumholzibacteriota bacterium]